MDLRPYDPAGDRDALWRLKRAFERELGARGTGEKAAAYESKVTDGYRARYLDWVDRCVAESPDCLIVAGSEDALVGYGFVLPDSLALIWDAAVLNELYVDPDRRGSGLADAILDALLSVARDQSLPLDRVVLDVAPANGQAVAFYDRHGFEPWGDLLALEL